MKNKIKAAPSPGAKAVPVVKVVTLKEKIFIFALTLAAAVLILTNLGNSYFWRDEAHTALLGKTILTHGVPKGTDGFNSYSGDTSGSRSDMNEKGTWVLTPWLPYYLVAPFTKLSPEGTEWALRLPFAIFGIMTVPLLYFLTRRFFNERVAGIAAVFLVFYVPFLLYSRQCRYYALAMFFSTWLLMAYDKYLKKEKYAAAHFFLAQLCLFHSQYMIWVVVGAAIGAHILFFSREKDRFLFLGVICVLINLPWISLFRQKAMGDIGITGAATFFKLLPKYFAGVNNDLVPFALPAFFFLFKYLIKTEGAAAAERDRVYLLLFLLPVNIFMASITSGYFFRYFVGIIPAAIALNAFMVDSICRRNKIAGGVIAACLIFTNILAVPMKVPMDKFWAEKLEEPSLKKILRFSFLDYLYEITHKYEGPDQGIVKILREKAKDGQTVLMADGDIPVKYYLPKLKVYGGLTGENGEAEREFDWLVPRRYLIDKSVRRTNTRINELAKSPVYERIELKYPDYIFENLPEPRYHLFRTARNIPPAAVYKNKKNP